MRQVELVATGQRRPLPRDIVGLNAPVAYAVPHEDPRLVDAARFLRPGHLRFPGGSVANFYNWRTGQFEVPEVEGGSMYRSYMRGAIARMRPYHPHGCRTDAFATIAGDAGAELLWVANLETSTPEEQAAWAASMRSSGILPRRIELGNEFYLALLNDPVSKARFPDWATTIGVMREYVDAMSASLDGTERIAVQAAASRWRADRDTGQGLHGQAWQWDDDMEPDEWFHAVTVHPYPEIDHVCGPGTSASLPGATASVVPALLARADDGCRRLLDHTAERMPGKQIWVTEWGPGEIGALLQGRAPTFNGMWFHVMARMALAMLRHPAVAVVTYHAFFFDGGIFSIARPAGGGDGYTLNGAGALLRWLCEAANGGAEHERVSVDGAALVRGGGLVAVESYADVDAALFRRGARAAVLVQNASDEPVRARLEELGLGEPGAVESMAPDAAASLAGGPPAVDGIAPASEVTLAPWSLTRLTW